MTYADAERMSLLPQDAHDPIDDEAWISDALERDEDADDLPYGEHATSLHFA